MRTPRGLICTKCQDTLLMSMEFLIQYTPAHEQSFIKIETKCYYLSVDGKGWFIDDG